MHFPQSHYFKMNETLLRFVGQLPHQKTGVSVFKRLLVMVILGITGGIEIRNAILNFKNIDYLLTLFPELMLFSGSAISVYLLNPNIEIITTLFDLFVSDWKSSFSNEELEIKETLAKKTKILSIMAVVYSYALYMPTIIVYKLIKLIMPNNQSHATLTLLREHKFNEKFNYLFLLFVYVSHFTVSLHLLSNCLIAATYVIHAYGMFKIVGYRYEHLFSADESLKSKHVMNKKYSIYRSVFICIEAHQDASRFFLLLLKQYKATVILLIIFCLMMLSFNLALLSNITAMPFMTFVLTVGIMFFLTTVCFMCQKLTDEVENIGNCIYNSKWYNYPTRLQKFVIFIIQKSNSNMLLFSSNIFNLSVENLLLILKTALSYCIVLKNVR